MRIGIIGTGNMAEALGGQWARAGHEILVGGRDPARAGALAARIGARPGTLADSARFGDATLLALPYDAVLPVLDAVGELRGRILVDCTNAIGPGPTLTTGEGGGLTLTTGEGGGPTLTTGEGPGAARRIAAATGARVVKAFNHVTPAVWSRTPPVFADGPLSVPLCGDDEEALALVATLAKDMGCAPLVTGPLAHADLLEAATAFLIGLWHSGHDPRTLLPPPAAMGG
ncbi:NAD(P)-binding domain-containing protein [Streptomyces sp. ISL-36]|uniref:NADPH-dependent F420 reductase n=1 Tax=Streptomyces sp. ISL-36 TaxID=2819182 RepID=UPI001BEB39DF|nr:NAD(P)-binding domain-containing protein [Streptomyces sp. ISL-36]MBT2442653.1 NAD(P)-binding domain-containing protein [Streptomyces sp. ISL-36]